MLSPSKSWLLLVALAAAALAQPPDILPVPSTAPAWVRSKLQGKADQLHRNEEQLDLEVGAHRARCQGAVEGTPQAQKCAQERDLLEARVEKYGQEVKAFNQQVTGLEQTNGLQSLAEQLKPEGYAMKAGQTQCSRFLRDFARQWAGEALPEMEGRASDQIAHMQQGGAWRELPLKDGFEPAILAAYQGKLVVVAWLNPKPTAANSGHVAVVMPHEPVRAGVTTRSGKPGWNMSLPYIAQAGTKTGSLLPMSEGFPPTMKGQVRVFVRDRPGQ